MAGLRRGAVQAAAAALLLAAALQLQLAAAQSCGNIDIRAAGAGQGQPDDAQFFRNMDADGSVGLIYMAAGTYRIASNLIINKPILAEPGAIFSVNGGVALWLLNQPEKPLTTFFTGDGSVSFREGTLRVFPEWFAARGDGQGDDAPAVNKAYRAASDTGNAMLYLTKTYALGSELVFGPTATIMSEPSAWFVPANGNPNGLTFGLGGYPYKNVLPNFRGFGNFCLRLLGSDLAAMQAQNFLNCGDAIRFETTGGNDINAALDNTVWFNEIRDSNVGIAYRATPGQCNGAACIMQGNHVIGNVIVGAIGGQSRPSALGFFYNTWDVPAWDSNQLDVGTIQMGGQGDYAVVRAEPLSNRLVLKVGSLIPGGGRVFDGKHNLGVYNLNLASQLGEYQLGLWGELDLIEFSGAVTPAPGVAVRCQNGNNQKGWFNGGRSLVGNYFTIHYYPDSNWQPGEIRSCFVYTQLATEYLYQIKVDAPKSGTSGLPIVSATQAQDNSKGPGGFQAVADELQIWLINSSGYTLPAGQAVGFNLALGTLGSA